MPLWFLPMLVENDQVTDVTPVSLEFKAVKKTSANLSAYTFSGYGLTSADTGKLAIAVVESFNGSGAEVPSSVTIGGASASKIAGTTVSAVIDSAVSIWQVAVPSSPTDEISATFGKTHANCAIALYLLQNVNTTPFDTDESEEASSAASTTLTLNTALNGITIVANVQRLNGLETGTTLSGGITKDVEVAPENQFGLFVTGSRPGDVAATGETITITPPSSDLMHSVAASWEPA